MKIHGQFYRLRGSNKKYPELDDLDALFEALKVECVQDYATRKGIPPNSVMYRVKRYFPSEWINQIVKKKAYHRKKKPQD